MPILNGVSSAPSAGEPRDRRPAREREHATLLDECADSHGVLLPDRMPGWIELSAQMDQESRRSGATRCARRQPALHVLLDQAPDAVLDRMEARLALDRRAGAAARSSTGMIVLDPSRPAGEDDDAVGQVDRLVDLMGDEQHGLSAFTQIRSSSSCISSRVCASSEANGSSISRIFGSMTSARARLTRCCMPPDSS